MCRNMYFYIHLYLVLIFFYLDSKQHLSQVIAFIKILLWFFLDMWCGPWGEACEKDQARARNQLQDQIRLWLRLNATFFWERRTDYYEFFMGTRIFFFFSVEKKKKERGKLTLRFYRTLNSRIYRTMHVRHWLVPYSTEKIKPLKKKK